MKGFGQKKWRYHPAARIEAGELNDLTQEGSFARIAGINFPPLQNLEMWNTVYSKKTDQFILGNIGTQAKLDGFANQNLIAIYCMFVAGMIM